MDTKSKPELASPAHNYSLLSRVGSLPLLRTPQPPATYLPSPRETAARPDAEQEVVAAAVAAEVSLWSEAFIAHFGAEAPHPADLAEAFTMADGWSRERQKALAWLAYAELQRATAWEVVMAFIAELRGPFEAARLRDVELPLRFPALARFFGLQDVGERRAARRAARVKKEKLKADGDATSQG